MQSGFKSSGEEREFSFGMRWFSDFRLAQRDACALACDWVIGLLLNFFRICVLCLFAFHLIVRWLNVAFGGKPLVLCDRILSLVRCWEGVGFWCDWKGRLECIRNKMGVVHPILNQASNGEFWKLKFESEFQNSLDKLFFLIPELCEGTIVRQLATGRWGLPDHFEFCANSVLIFRLVWCFPIL